MRMSQGIGAACTLCKVGGRHVFLGSRLGDSALLLIRKSARGDGVDGAVKAEAAGEDEMEVEEQSEPAP